MIHELIDPKKKTVKSGGTAKGGKNLSDFSTKLYSDQTTINFEQSDTENKGAGSVSNTFIPPWLKNSLGLSQRNNQNLDWSVCLPSFTALGHAVSDQKSSKIISRCKEEGNNASEGFKRSITPDCTIRMTCDPDSLSRTRHCRPEINCRSLDVPSTDRVIGSREENKPANRHVDRIWSTTRRESVRESMNARSEIKLVNRGNFHKVTQLDISVNETDKVKDEDKRRLSKLAKPRNKVKKCNANCEQSSDLSKNDSIESSWRKEGKSLNADTKQLEAKLILLETKCRDANLSKLNHQEFRLLQEIKERTGNGEDFEKFMGRIRERNLKEWLKISEGSTLKIDGEKIKKEEVKMVKGNFQHFKGTGEGEGGEVKPNSDKDSLKSTDEENDIKRFSEFLSTNKNMDEKRKCLEEVRNYFERKRRTRLTKRRCHEENKISKCDDEYNFLAKKDDFPRERPATKDMATANWAKERKNKFVPCNEEVVEKAVSETLQKFMSLYHFHVSPTMMGSMRKNILEAIQSDSLESSPSKKNLMRHSHQHQHQKGGSENANGKKSPGKSGDNNFPADSRENDCRISNPGCGVEAVGARVPDSPLSAFEPPPNAIEVKEIKKSSFKTLVDASKMTDHGQRSSRENDVLENENFKRLKREFENCLKSVQFHADGTALKIQSLVLEKEETPASKGIRFVYNFSKKSLEFIQLDCEQNKGITRGVQEKEISRKSKEVETQTFPWKINSNKKSMKCQTTGTIEGRNQSLQTEEKPLATIGVQTETETAKGKMREVKELKDFDISPGLYRMVKSKDVGRFYLYPEREEESKPRILAKGNLDSGPALKFKQKLEGQPKVEPKLLVTEGIEKPEKEMKILFRDKHRARDFGKETRRRKKSLSRNGSLTLSKEECVETKINNSISCLFFGNGMDGCQKKENSTLVANDELEEAGVEECEFKDDHFGCFWFWNGEKIGPGCDLKTHVEDLLKEKLKEINEKVGKVAGVGTSSGLEEKSSQVVWSKSFEKDPYPPPNSNAVFCLRKDDFSRTSIFPQPFLGLLDGEKDKNWKQSVGNMEESEKAHVRDVGTQNPQNGFFSFNMSKMRTRSKTSTGSKMSGRRRKRWTSSRGNRELRGEIPGLKAIANLVKAVRELKRLEAEADDEKDSSPDTSSLTDATTSSSATVGHNNDLPNSESSISKSKTDGGDEMNGKKKMIKEIDARGKEKNSTTEKWNRDKGGPGRRHWELIENVLNRVSLKEREGLWNDIRQFIKKKIGRDINEEGAREVCIEIEQDVPRSPSGKMKHPVMARGHYIRNEGDVEVEIDLTLDDLEKILRQRHRKMRRRHMWNSTKAKKLFSSSSAQSGLTRKESRRYRPSSMDLLH